MHYVGVDLAWGHKRPTGVAALSAEGDLLHVSTEGDDASVLAAMAPYVEGDCVVGIDAPLVVTNPRGNRPAEAALNKDFARFDAGAHPSNTAKPEFAVEPRGAVVARKLDLDIDPVAGAGAGATRRAIEVYPHAATVALFRLGRTLKYKNKPGRTLAGLTDELRTLMRLVEGLRDAPLPMRVEQSEQWRALVDAVASAGRKSELRKVEDQVDAVVCAYVAMFADRRPELTTTYGDLATGYIVTPTLPADHVPSPRLPRTVVDDTEPPAPDGGLVRRAVTTYAALHPALTGVTEDYVSLVTTLLDDAGINYLSVGGRTKSVASFAAKADRTAPDGAGGRPVYTDPLTEITDQVGVRVITYIRSDVEAVAQLLRDQLHVLDDRDMGEETARQGRFGYASRHLLVARPGAGEAEGVRGRPAQVQVRTVLQHAWAEFEHATRYKGTVPAEHVSDLDRRFTLAAGLLELADQEFSAIHDRLQVTATDLPEPDAADPRIGAQELATFLSGQFADSGWSRPDHYSWVSGLLLELGVTSVEELGGLLTSVDSPAIDVRMDYRYPPGAVRRLDDALLAIFGTRYLDLHGNAHRRDLLATRLDRLRSKG